MTTDKKTLSKYEVFRIVRWAEKLAQLYEVEIANIIARFLEAKKYFKDDIDAIMKFCEDEINVDYITLMTSEVEDYDSDKNHSYQRRNTSTCIVK